MKPDAVCIDNPNDEIHLLPLAHCHAEDLYAACSGKVQLSWMDMFDAEQVMWRFTPYSPYDSLNHFKEQYIEKLNADPTRRPCTIYDNVHKRAIGCVSLMNNNAKHCKVEVGSLWLAPAYHGTYVLPQVMMLLLKHTFEKGYTRIEWKCHKLNHRSFRAAGKLGFQYEACMHNHMIQKDRSRDSCWFAMIPEDWALAQLKLETLRDSLPKTVHRSIPSAFSDALPDVLSEDVLSAAKSVSFKDVCKVLDKGALTRLVPIDESHYNMIFAMLMDDDKNRRVDGEYSVPATVEELGNIIKELSSENGQIFTIFHQSCGADQSNVIGLISILNNTPDCLRAEIGHLTVHSAYDCASSSLIREAIGLLIELLRDLKYRRIEWRCNSEDQKLNQFVKELGFEHEGTFRNYYIIKEKPRNIESYALAQDKFNDIIQRLKW